MGLGMSINCQSYTLLISAPNKEGSYSFSEILVKIMVNQFIIQIGIKASRNFIFILIDSLKTFAKNSQHSHRSGGQIFGSVVKI